MRHSKRLIALAAAGLLAACSGAGEAPTAAGNQGGNLAEERPEPETANRLAAEPRQAEQRPERPLPDYAAFQMSDAQRDARLSRTYNDCMGAASSTADYRSCSSAEFERIEALMRRALAQAEANVSEGDRERFRSEQRRWREGLPDLCQRELEEEGAEGGSMDLLTLDNCSLRELVRRTSWLESLD